ncbi:MAG: threonine/serine exporter family protein [Muribaculum sp.]|nr:threonine/serine exporter family protein [Muribaculum sp.]
MMISIVTKMTAKNKSNVTAADASRFLAVYSAYLWGYGATCIRITKNVNRMAEYIGYRADITILPKHVAVALTDDSTGEYSHYTCAIKTLPVSYMANTRMSKLSWDVAEGKVSITDAEAILGRISRAPHMSVWVVMCLVVFANAAFCRLFGGDPAAMVIVGFATLLGYAIKNICLKHKMDVRAMVLLASFVSAVVGSGGYVFGITSTPEIALGTSVLYLIPGIPYINSVSDMIDGHYLCFFSRTMQAIVLTGCIAAGLTLAFMIMNINVF